MMAGSHMADREIKRPQKGPCLDGTLYPHTEKGCRNLPLHPMLHYGIFCKEKTALKLGGALFWLNMYLKGEGFKLDDIHIRLLSKFTFYLTLNGWCFKTKFK